MAALPLSLGLPSWLLALVLCLSALAPLAAEARPAARPGAAAAAKEKSQRQADDAPRVELNSAGVEELCTLPGIGPKKAEAIIAYRERQPFTRVTQLLRIKGIGARTLERLRPFIYVAPPGAPLPRADGPEGRS